MTAQVTCPYCWQAFDLAVDISGGATQQFVVDCEICCRPITCIITLNEDGTTNVNAERNNE